MFRKNYFTFLLTVALFTIGSFAAFAQTGAPISGQVLLKDGDKVTPVADALVEVYRVDINSKFPSAKTDKKGYFRFASLPFGATFALSVSGAGIGPEIIPGVKAGMDKLVINVLPGDGKKWTEEEVRQGLANSSSGSTQNTELTAEQKKAQAEYEKKVKEVNEKNAKIKSQTEAVQKALTEGNDAYAAKDYDLAVAKYEEGFQANPDFVGSAPVLLNNKGAALTARAVATFNANSGSKDPTVKVEAMKKVRQDLSDAADAYNKSWTILTTAPATDVSDPKTHDANKLTALRGAKEAFRLMAATGQVDESKIEIARNMFAEYMKVETEMAKKTEAQRVLGDLYRVIGDSENSIAEYQKVLEINPEDPDALAGIGLSLVNLGYINNDKAKFQEGANYLQKYIDVAPANHKFVNDAKGLIEILKNEQKVAPQKSTTKTTTKKKN
jgi:tetratricopeptide (TPR) repeat protein